MFNNIVCFLNTKAIQKGNMEGAKIHAENAIRQKNQVLEAVYLSCSPHLP